MNLAFWTKDYGLKKPVTLGVKVTKKVAGTVGQSAGSLVLKKRNQPRSFDPEVTAVIVNSSLEQAAKDKSLLYLCQQMSVVSMFQQVRSVLSWVSLVW